MNSARANQSNQVNVFVVFFGVCESFHDLWFFPKCFVTNGFGNLHHVLIDDPAGTDVVRTAKARVLRAVQR